VKAFLYARFWPSHLCGAYILIACVASWCYSERCKPWTVSGMAWAVMGALFALLFMDWIRQ